MRAFEGTRNVQARSQEIVTENLIGERRLWLAVVMQAVEEWRGGTLRSQRKAQEFIFDHPNDFDTVCANAGLDAENLRSRLRKLGRMVAAQGAWPRPVAA